VRVEHLVYEAVEVNILVDLIKTDRHGAESFRVWLSWHLGVELIDVVQE
jgi:hypothetical protein